MPDKYGEAFEEIVFIVTRLIFGDTKATSSVYQNCCREALRSLGLVKIIMSLKEE